MENCTQHVHAQTSSVFSLGILGVFFGHKAKNVLTVCTAVKYQEYQSTNHRSRKMGEKPCRCFGEQAFLKGGDLVQPELPLSHNIGMNVLANREADSLLSGSV